MTLISLLIAMAGNIFTAGIGCDSYFEVWEQKMHARPKLVLSSSIVHMKGSNHDDKSMFSLTKLNIVFSISNCNRRPGNIDM